MTIPESVFKIGAYYRNPDLFKEIQKLLDSDYYSIEQLFQIKQNKLFELLSFVAKHSEYYKTRLGKFTKHDVFEILSSLEPLSKADLIDHQQELNCYHRFKKLFLAETSGTSGTTFKFYKNVDWDTKARSSWMRGYTWYGVQPWDKNGYFWGYSQDHSQQVKTRVLDKLQNRFRLFSYNDKEVDVFLHKLRSSVFLHGYSSMIYEVAQKALERGLNPTDFPNLKMIKGTSEKIYPYYQNPVKEVFGQKIISEYGAAEAGIIAFECPFGHMHVNEENVVLEVIDGEIVVTNLNAFSIPIIRYKLGDAVKVDTKTKCSCGRSSTIITEIEGRVGKKIIGKHKTYPSLTLYYVFKNISLEKGVDIQYQAVQREKGKIDLKVTKKLSLQEEEWIGEQLNMYFADDLSVSIFENQEIHDKKGKLKDFVTEID